MTEPERAAPGYAERRRLLIAALGFALLDDPSPAVATLKRWLHTWNGIGLIAAGMARQGYDVTLARYDELGWRATFYVTGREHSATEATGSAFEPSPFRAVELAALAALWRSGSLP